MVMEDVIWRTAKADSHILNHVEGFSNQKPGRLMEELTAAKRNSLPWLGTAGLLPAAAAAAAAAAELIRSRSSAWSGGTSLAAFLGLAGKDMI